MLTRISSVTLWGVTAYPVDVEVDLSFGMMQFHIVGLPDAAIRESKQRILTALKQCGFRLPERKITVNLAPASTKKEGTLFDLPIALGILHEAGLIDLTPQLISETFFIGELSLDGSIKAVRGVLPIACDSKRLGKTRIVLPLDNASEAAHVQQLEIIGVDHLKTVVAHLRGEKSWQPYIIEQSMPVIDDYASSRSSTLCDVQGQKAAKRALQISAAGRHNILFIGSPGSGKTMLAQRLPHLMPALCAEEMLETSKIYSVMGKLPAKGLMTQRPFCAPHHTISAPGLIGGGSIPQPGQISMAHNGILFLDECTEFKSSVLDALRQPLESRTVTIVRAQQTVTFPASFLLVMALNPCPCGFLHDKRRSCTCSPQRIKQYINRLSGPLLDRIDLQVTVTSINYGELEEARQKPETPGLFYEGIQQAIKAQKDRFKEPLSWNGQMTPLHIERYCILDEEAERCTKVAFEKLNLTMRGYHKLLKIARTIADIEGEAIIKGKHVVEALSYRVFETE